MGPCLLYLVFEQALLAQANGPHPLTERALAAGVAQLDGLGPFPERVAPPGKLQRPAHVLDLLFLFSQSERVFRLIS